MLKNDEELRDPNCRNKGGANRREGASENEKSVLQYLRSILYVATPLWVKCEMKLTLPKVGTWSP